MTGLLDVRGVAKHFGGLRAVDGVDLVVEPLEIRAVIGPNGAGKTTLFNLITGYLRPDSGRVVFDGEDITGQPTHKVSRAGIGRAFQITSIFPGLSVTENVRVALIAGHGQSGRLLGRVGRMHTSEARELIADVGLDGMRNRLAGTLSHGSQRALEIAISLAIRPKLLLLDEPTAGMAPEESRDAISLVRRVAQERRLSVLFCEHDMEVVFGFADRILVMHQGKPYAEGSPDEIRSDPRVQKIYLGEEEE